MMNLAYGPARPMPAEERSQFGLQNWLLRWLSSLSPEKRAQAGVLSNSSSSGPTSQPQSDVTLTGTQEEPEQEIPAGDHEGPSDAPPQDPQVVEDATDEAWDPTPPMPRPTGPSEAAAKACPRAFQRDGEPPIGDGGRRYQGMGVYITKYGQKYHIFDSRPTLTSSVLRSSLPFIIHMADVRRGEQLWSRGWGEIYHVDAAPACATEEIWSLCPLPPGAP